MSDVKADRGAPPGRSRALAGAVITALVALALVADGALGFVAPQVLKAEMAAAGFPAVLGAPISLLAIACGAVYALPQTRVLGAILVTGFLGGAICTHLRMGDVGSPPQIVSLVLGVLAWAGAWLQDARLRALLPLTR